MTQPSSREHKKIKIFPSADDDVQHAKRLCESVSDVAPSLRLAYDDPDFLMWDEMRGVRLQLEFCKPELTLNDHKIEQTIVMFGSARIPGPNVSGGHKKLSEYRQYYEEARKLAYKITKSTLQGDIPTMHVITGGGPGIMEAANRGALEAGGISIGLNIVLPYEQGANPYITPELSFQFHYFAIRKMHLLLRSKALVVFPGGYGTLDELFETLTLVQTGKIEPLPILLFGQKYWERLINFELLVEEGMIDEKDLSLFSYVENCEEAWQFLEAYLNQTNTQHVL